MFDKKSFTMEKISNIFFKINYLLIVFVVIYYFLAQAYFPSWLFFIHYDMKVYYDSSSWLLGEGKLYIDFPSEYPLFANLIFAFCRFISLPFSRIFGDLNSFYLTWIFLGISAWLITIKTAKDFILSNRIIKLCWILPAIILFSINRYDIYPVLFFVLSFISLKKRRIFLAAILIGISISLKGYSLFTLPSLLYFLYVNYGMRRSIYFAFISIAPFLISNLIVLIFLGNDALISAYEFHMVRTFNGASTWDVLNLKFLVDFIPNLPTITAVIFAIFGFLRRPKNLSELADSCLIATTGFASSLVFYSPQFCFWTLSCATFSENQKIWFLTFCLCFFTYIYYPLADVFYGYGTRGDNASFIVYKLSILVVTLFRLLIIFRAFPKINNKKFNSIN